MSLASTAVPGCEYFLAHDIPQGLSIDDGCHGSPEEVVKAAKIYKRIFGLESDWLMVRVQPLPDLDPPIDEDSDEILHTAIMEHRAK